MQVHQAQITLPEPAHYRVLEQYETSTAHVLLAECLSVPTTCPHCSHAKLGAWSYHDQIFRDLPQRGKQVEIHISTKRLVCKKCKKTFFQTLPGMSERRVMTQRLAAWIGEQGLDRTFISIAEDIGVVEGTVRNVFADFVEAMEKAVQIETPQWMSLLEVSVLNKTRTLVINSQARTVVDLLFGRNKVILGKYFGRLKEPERVQLVGMGFSDVSRDAVQGFLPSAAVFVDKPYVLALVDQGLVSVRAEIRGQISAAEQRALWPMLMVRHGELPARTAKEQATVQTAWERYPILRRVSLYRESIHALYDGPAAQGAPAAIPAARGILSSQAEEAFTAAFSKLEAGEHKHFTALQKALVEWRAPILNYFKYECARASISNLGDLSHLDEQIERVGRSYVFEALRCKMLFPDRIPELHYRSVGMGMHLLRTN